MLRLIECLKATGMSIKDIKQFVDWTKLGDASLKERHDMFLERKRVVEEQMEALQKTMDLISYKCWYYETALEAGTEKAHEKLKNEAKKKKPDERHLILIFKSHFVYVTIKRTYSLPLN